MKKIFIFLLFLFFLNILTAENTKKVSVKGTDFYYIELAYKDYCNQPGHIFKQDKDKVDSYIAHLEELLAKYKKIESEDELYLVPRDERYDFSEALKYKLISKSDFINYALMDINSYKFNITYEENKITVHMFIDSPTVRGGDATYVFDSEGNLLEKNYGA